ncbi:hypothetical protein [Moraxella bovis]|uniref:hypothetical protein n=1 Tax=Moraxella bovis TaxID=476 RepID=UPI00227A326A|nr:hypothetical protein [Moraxella bovis]WAJ74548.1 hypothetical protein LP095_05200 [Moraxella bovis]WAJ74801.1 hypothetical protein LP095_06560 [Moraxella bovis]
MNLTPAKIRRELAKISFTTAHAKIYKANAITHMLTYEKSVASQGEIDLSALFAVYCHLSWLSNHVREINDKQVLPSERLFIANALSYVSSTYNTQRSV